MPVSRTIFQTKGDRLLSGSADRLFLKMGGDRGTVLAIRHLLRDNRPAILAQGRPPSNLQRQVLLSL